MFPLKVKWPPGSMPPEFSSPLVRISKWLLNLDLGLLPPGQAMQVSMKLQNSETLYATWQENKITEAMKGRTINQQMRTEMSSIMRRVKLGTELCHSVLPYSLQEKNWLRNRSALWNCWKMRLERRHRKASLALSIYTKLCWEAC